MPSAHCRNSVSGFHGNRAVAGARSDNGELAKLLALAAGCSRVVVFSGSGLSAPSGAAARTQPHPKHTAEAQLAG